MYHQCTKCGEMFHGESCGECGWKVSVATKVDVNHGRCCWKTCGLICGKTAAISPDLSGPRRYCSWHYECVMNPEAAKDPEFRAWFDEREKVYAKKKNPIVDQWDDLDKHQVQGLVMLGKDSIVWGKAPKYMCEAAEKLIVSGWEPNDFKMQKRSLEL